MALYTEIAGKLGTYAGPRALNDEIRLTSIAIGILAYIIIFVPMISFLLVGTLNLSIAYVIPIAMAWVLAGIYVTERYICR